MKPRLKKMLVVILLLVITTQVQSQPSIQWQSCYGGSGNDEGNFIQPTSDGGYIMIGSESLGDGDVAGGLGPSRDGRNFWVVKLSSTGAIQWRRSLGGTNLDVGHFIQQTTDGGYIICGETFSTQNVNPFNNSDLNQLNKGQNDFWIVKLTSAGAISWERNYGGSFSDLAYCIQQTNDGGYIAVGYTQSNNGDVTNYIGGGSDVWVLKINNAGGIEWQKNYGGNLLDYAQSVIQTNDGGYIIAGFSNSTTGNVTAPKGNNDYWVAKISSTGTIEWQNNYGGSGNDRAYSIKQTSEGGYIVLGTSNSTNGDKTDLNGSVWIVKITSTGTITWNKSYGSGEGRCIIQTSDGGYVLTGQVVGGFGVTGVHTTSSTTTDDIWVAKLASTGDLTWQKSMGGFNFEYGRSIWTTSDGGYIVCGTTRSANDGDVTNNHTNSFLPTDCWVVKLNNLSLPVQLTNFSAQQTNANITLRWNTQNEINLSCYEVEKSNNGSNFNKAGVVIATGLSSYYWVDASPNNASNYFRLKMMDKDGSFSYTSIVTVKKGGVKNVFTIAGNPVKKNTLVLQMENVEKGNYTISIYDNLGQQIRNKTIVHGGGSATETLNVGKLASGIYQLSISGSHIKVSKAIVIE